MDPKYITKEYSIAVINHAIASAKFNNEKQADIAFLLGVDNSNIPKYKSGKQKLSPNNVKILTEHYGMPRQAKGEYIEATLYKSVDEYLNAIDERIKDLYCSALTELFRSPKVMKAIASAVTARPIRGTDNSDPFTRMQFSYQGCEDEEIPQIISWVNDAIKTDSFKQWYEEMLLFTEQQSANERYIRQSTPPPLDKGEWCNALIFPDDTPLFFLLADYYFNFSAKFALPFEGTFKSKHYKKEPVVLTGDEILNLLPNYHPFVRRTSHVFLDRNFSSLREKPRIGGIDLSSELGPFKDLSPSEPQIFLFMNKDMVYRLYIIEYWKNKKFDIVITDIPQQEIFNVFGKLQETFGFDKQSEFELRTKVAEAGGFIPGARVL
jgi:hypothetical protein